MEQKPMEKTIIPITAWVPITGRWEFTAGSARYVGPDKDASPPHGIALSNAQLRSGTIETRVQFFDDPKQEGRILFGFKAHTHPQSLPYYSAGIGGHYFAYCVQQFLPGAGWRPLAGAGGSDNFTPNAQFKIRIEIHGQKVTLIVDDIRVLEHNLPSPLTGDQVGLFAVGPGPVDFKIPIVTREKPKLFVIMQYGEPFDDLYADVIEPVACKKNLHAFRATDIYKPGVILQDIIQSVTESEVIVAEITPPNPNVFYELGYAHALQKTTILLADVESKLEKHLSAVLDEL